MKKGLLKTRYGLSLLGMIAAGAASAAAPVKLGPGEGEVVILAWPGYIERGQTEKDYDWVTAFEKATGCAVKVKTAGTSDAMVELMTDGGIDLVTASGDASLRLINNKQVQPIDIGLVPSYGAISPELQNAPWHTRDGRHYGVPYQWGPNVLMYNTKVFPTPPASWDVVFRETTLPDGKSNQGRVQAYDGPIAIADAALVLKTQRPDLKIADPYALSEEQYKAALELVRGQKKIVSRYWHDAMVQVDDFTQGGIVASSTWPFQVNLLRAKGQPVASIIPAEGATGWADTTMMHAKAAHPNCAYRWMEHSLDRKVQGDIAAWFGSVPAVPAACKGNALLGEDGCRQNGSENFGKISFWITPVSRCGDGKTCVPYYRWASDYIKLMFGQ